MTVTLKWACYYETILTAPTGFVSLPVVLESPVGKVGESCDSRMTHTNLWYWPTVLVMNFLYSSGHISLIPRPDNEGEGECIDSSLQNIDSL